MYSKILDHPEAIQPLCLVTGFFQAVLCHYSEFIYSFVGKLNIMIPTFYHQIPTFSYFSPTFFLNWLLLFSYFFIKTHLKAWKWAVGLKINDSEKNWTPGAHVPPPRGKIHVYLHNIRTSSLLKLLGKSKPNFM